MKKLLTTLALSFVLLFASAGCAAFNFSNDLTDQQRLASIAITYESVLDGLIAARTNGILDDDAYRRVDPIVDTVDKFIFLLKAHVDSGQAIDEDTYARVNRLLDSILAILLELESSDDDDVSMQIDDIRNIKLQLETQAYVTI